MRNLLTNYGYENEPRNLGKTIYRCYRIATEPMNQFEGMDVVFLRNLVKMGIAEQVNGVVNFVGRKTPARKRELTNLHIALNMLHATCVKRLSAGARVLSCDILDDVLSFYESDDIVYDPLAVRRMATIMLMMRGKPNDTAASF